MITNTETKNATTIPTASTAKFASCEVRRILDQLQQACAEHNGDCEVECELSRNRSCNTDKERSDDSCARTGSAWEKSGYKLEHTDNESGLVCKLVDLSDLWLAGLVPVFNDDECDTECNKCNCYYPRIVEVIVYPVVNG